jgi:hypothetical protein
VRESGSLNLDHGPAVIHYLADTYLALMERDDTGINSITEYEEISNGT